MKRIYAFTAVVVTTLLLAPVALLAAGGSSGSVPSPDPPPLKTPEQKAMTAYNDGLEYRDKAWKLEEQAAEADGEKSAKKLAKAQKAYQKAIGRFRDALEQVADFHEAWSSLGYALRKTGQYQESLEAYDRSLAINPSYVEAIEYRGEAYLGLNRLEEAKGAYMQLFQMDRERAAELMTAMKRWLEERSKDAGELSPDVIESFATWVEERSELVAQVGTLAAKRSW